MNIVILGAGNVAQALAQAWIKKSHQVSLAVRNPSRTDLQALKSQGIEIVPIKGAIAKAAVVVLAVTWNGAENVIKEAGPFDGQILIDATNPLSDQLELAIGHNDSAGETIARLAKGARVVKAFNTTGAQNMANPSFPGGRLMMPIAGDDESANATVLELAAEIGFDAIDAGPLTMARYLEATAMLWIKLAYARQMGPDFGFALLRR